MKSVYIHIPFCKNICTYCDFCKFFYNKEWIDKYLISLKKEINDNYKKEKIKTIYIGGGTPSSLTTYDTKKLLEITKVFDLIDNYEFTIEMNVEDITEEKLILYKEYNINRISVGVQSFNKKILKEMNRNYNVNISEKINLVKKHFLNVNIDLIYGYPDQSIDDLKNDLDKFISLDVKHISIYNLIVEEHTKLYNSYKKNDNQDDIDSNMYKFINKVLKDNNYNRYEISNFSKEGFESKHNLTYWNNEEYYGFGVGASSYINNERINNKNNIINYNKFIYDKEVETLDINDKMKYEMILGLRKTKGVCDDDFYKKYNYHIKDIFDIENLIKDGLLVFKNGYYYINEEYIFLSNEILLNFI